MKKSVIIVVIIFILVILGYVLLNKKKIRIFINESNQISKESIGSKEFSIKRNNSILSEQQKKKQKRKEKEFFSKNAQFIGLLDSFIKLFCEGKENIEAVTCSPSYSIFEPKVYAILYQLGVSGNNYDTILGILYGKLTKWCNKLSDYDIEILFRKIKLNSFSCVKEDIKAAKSLEKRLKDFFEKNKVTEDNIVKPFDVYYLVKGVYFIPDVEEEKIQAMIISEIQRSLKEQNIDEKKFKNLLLKRYNVDTVEELKHKIVEDWKMLWYKYELKKCGLNINGEENYFIYGKIRQNCLKFIKNYLSSDRNFEKDVREFFDMIDVYSYLSKDFLGAKFRAKASFGPEGVGIVEFLDIYNNLKNVK